MNTMQITPLKDGICYVCQTNPATHVYSFPQKRGFGSAFEGLDIKFCCCDECNRRRYDTWFNDPPIVDDIMETYKNETALCRLIESLPANAQEKIYNACDDAPIDAQDWIDMRLGEMTDEQKAKYGLDDELFATEYEI